MSLQENEVQPSFIRYQRVENILNSEPVFRSKITDRTEIVMKPNGRQHKFSIGVVKTTEAIHADGKDAYNIPRTEVVKMAMQVIGVGSVNTNGHSEATPSPLSVPKPTKAKTKAVAAAKPKVEKAAPAVSAPKEPKEAKSEKSEPKDDLLCPAVAIYSMLMGAKTMAVKHDKSEGFEKRVKVIETLAKEYRELAS